MLVVFGTVVQTGRLISRGSRLQSATKGRVVMVFS